jgi:serine/threonine-protein phosphatase PP1 catalytic subunit
MASGKNINKATAKKELSLLLPKIDRILESESAVLRIDVEPIMVIWDIHGHLEALNLILEKRGNKLQKYSLSWGLCG